MRFTEFLAFIYYATDLVRVNIVTIVRKCTTLQNYKMRHTDYLSQCMWNVIALKHATFRNDKMTGMIHFRLMRIVYKCTTPRNDKIGVMITFSKSVNYEYMQL